ncbi:MAG: ATP-binding cassette domain-containing protein [Bacteroidales bacterium]|jgi:cell division transport system ATP-binding protein|nr:ATP-binding cassette domain-containing protein [Bacteroidales bacterium]
MSTEQRIVFNNVYVGYNSHNEVLQNVSFTLHAGELVYLIGKTASGKSSLLKTMYAEIAPLAGECSVAEYDLTHIRRSETPYLRRKVAIVFQDFQLLQDRTVAENLLFVLKATGWKKKKVMQTRIDDVLSQVGLLNKQSSMPHQLSGGEQQRVVIARALLNNPEIILADEPTGNLDPESSEEIFTLLHTIAQNGCAVFFVTHNYQLLKKFPAPVLQCENNTIVKNTDNEVEIDFESLSE